MDENNFILLYNNRLLEHNSNRKVKHENETKHFKLLAVKIRYHSTLIIPSIDEKKGGTTTVIIIK